MIILGINFLHADSSAFLVKDGVLVCGIDEERINRIKNSGGFPINAIKFCLEFANININDVDFITTNTSKISNIYNKFMFAISNFNTINKKNLLKKKNKNLKENLNFYFPNESLKAKIVYVDHHLSHVSSSYFCSNFEKSVNVSVDGSGDFVSTTIGYSKKNKIEITDKIYFPHSLGNLYQAVTNFLGFKKHGDEYKVMGMAGYGKPKYIEQISKLINEKKNSFFELNLKYFLHHINLNSFEIINNKIKLNQIYNRELFEVLFKIKERQVNEPLLQSHFNLACSMQHIYEKFFYKILNFAYEKFKISNLTLSGGCAMNSLANGKILQNTPFKKIFFQPASGDGGGSLGSALYQSSKINKIKRKKIFHSLLGKRFNTAYCFNAISKYSELKSYKVQKLNDETLNIQICKIIKNSGVIGRFVGRCEWGSRALGNRSILADPSNPNIKNIINLKIKKRECFRPFAPAILHEHGGDWFENYEFVPHMMQVLKIKKEKQSIIPAVTHVDGTGRLQSVDKNTNEKFYNLIKKFYDLYKIPLLLNTSFNENEPIVFTPENAIETFLKSKMDALILEDYLIIRK